MSARHGQGISAWLIMVPLLIVPLIAVFGVPQFTPITAQTADGADGEEAFLPLELGSEAPLAESVPPFPGGTIENEPSRSAPANPEGWTDPFENPTDMRPSQPPDGISSGAPSTATDPGLEDPFARPSGRSSSAPPDDFRAQPKLDEWSSPADIEGYSRTPDSGTGASNTTVPRSEPVSQLTWRQAVARLNELGVQKFQLSQTAEPFVFQFVCDLSRPDNPRVTHRFDAKAGEPLKAVENVIEQVELWSAQQAPR